jgi:hypothetical protein
VGPLIEDLRRHGAIPRAAKILATVPPAASLVTSIALSLLALPFWLGQAPITSGGDRRHPAAVLRGPPLKCVVPQHTWGSNGD